MNKFVPHKNMVALDCDGVFADFDGKFVELFGMIPAQFEDKYGTREFWKKINSEKTFFADLEMMDGAHEIYDAVKHLNPIFLTGAPSNIRSYDQKRNWVERFFGKEQKVIICKSSEKSLYCNPGDLIIDDMDKHMQKWLDKGGLWILHKSVNDTLEKLEALGISA